MLLIKTELKFYLMYRKLLLDQGPELADASIEMPAKFLSAL